MLNDLNIFLEIVDFPYVKHKYMQLSKTKIFQKSHKLLGSSKNMKNKYWRVGKESQESFILFPF